MDAESRLTELGLTLPPVPKPVANYRMAVRQGDLVYLSGHGPLLPDGTIIRGRVGADLDVTAGRQAARQVGLAMLATLRAELGSLARVRRVIKVLGLVQCTADFPDQPAVINGFSDLMVEVFGPDGRGARSAVGALALPGGMAVEVEAIVEVAEGGELS